MLRDTAPSVVPPGIEAELGDSARGGAWVLQYQYRRVSSRERGEHGHRLGTD